MKFIEKITKNNEDFYPNATQIQKICSEKLKLIPYPQTNCEKWRLTNKKKLTNFLDYSLNDEFHYPKIPKELLSKNVIRLIIGEKNKVNIKKDKFRIQELNDEEVINLLKENIEDNEPEENWSNLLNHCLTKKNNILGLKISGKELPPLEIFTNSNNGFFSARTLVLFIDEKTELEILQINLGSSNSSLSLSSYLILGEEAKVNHGLVSYGLTKSNLINSLNIIQKSNSEYNLGSLQFKFDFARFEASINQVEGKAKTNIKGIQITENNEQISTFTKIKFNGPNGYLNQVNKSLANDKSHSIFEGSIIVPKIAQRTDASQLSRNLLLSKYAKIDTKPQLEIIADDVKCKHGATISQLNENELFYMRSRGLTLTEANKLQLKSYYQEVISFIPVSKERWNLIDYLIN